MNTIYVIGPDPTLIKDPFSTFTIKVGASHSDGGVKKRLKTFRSAPGAQNSLILRTYKYPGFDSPIHDFLRSRFRDTCVFYPKHRESRELVDLRVKDFQILVDEIQRFINGELGSKLHTFKLRQEQIDCIEKTVAFFQRSPIRSEFLWDAKMRFGKTHCTYQVAKHLNCKTVLILTNRPTDTKDAWIDGLDHIDFTMYEASSFIDMSEQNAPLDLSIDKPRIIFASTQDFDLTKPKWSTLLDFPIDLIVKDESHLGTDTVRFIGNLSKLTYRHCLSLSGTPFRALLSGKFSNDSKYTWSYLDEQKARLKEIHDKGGEDNAAKYGDYYWLSPMRMFIMKLHEQMYSELEDFSKDEGFTFSKFFATNDKKSFLYDTAVEGFLDTLTSGRVMPFSRQNGEQGYDANNFKHTLWLLPGVDECKALAEKLRSHSFFKNYDVVVAAGDNDGEGGETANNVRDAITKIKIGKSEARGTITLTCGKLTHGVSIQQWGSVFNLSDIESSQLYFQFIFRIQTPYRDVKKECYVFDFNLNRTLKHLYKLARAQAIANNSNVVDTFKEMLYMFNPFYEGNALRDSNVNDLIAQVNSMGNTVGLGGVHSLVGRLGFTLTPELMEGVSGFARRHSKINAGIVVNEDKAAPNGKNSEGGIVANGNGNGGGDKEDKTKHLTEEEVRRALKVLLQTYLFLVDGDDFDGLRNGLEANAKICEQMTGLPSSVMGRLLDSFGWEDRQDITEAIKHFRILESKDNTHV